MSSEPKTSHTMNNRDNSVLDVVWLLCWQWLEIACLVDNGVKDAPKGQENQRKDDLAVGVGRESWVKGGNIKWGGVNCAHQLTNDFGL